MILEIVIEILFEGMITLSTTKACHKFWRVVLFSVIIVTMTAVLSGIGMAILFHPSYLIGYKILGVGLIVCNMWFITIYTKKFLNTFTKQLLN